MAVEMKFLVTKEIVDMVGIRPPEIFSMGKELHEDAFCYTVDEFLQSFV